MSGTAEELATTVSGLLGVEECVHHDEASPMELEDIDEDIRSMVASMCGDSGEGRVGGASPGGREASRPREVGEQVIILFKCRMSQCDSANNYGGLADTRAKSKKEAEPTHQVQRNVTAFKKDL